MKNIYLAFISLLLQGAAAPLGFSKRCGWRHGCRSHR